MTTRRALWIAFVFAVVAALTPAARAQDDFWNRPPLHWDDLESPLRAFCEIDDGAEWNAAWPKLEDAYLRFLAEEDIRRTVDAKPLADLFEPIEAGVADERATERYLTRW